MIREDSYVASDFSVILMYQSFDVTLARNVFKVNGVAIPGGIPVSSRRGEWKDNLGVL